MIIRKTKKVDTILALFEQTNEAMSVVDLTDHLKTQMNKTTVYRILDRMEKSGILHSFNDIHGLRWYAKCKGCSSVEHSDAHPHFQCLDCGNIECLSLDIEIPTITDRQVNSVEIILTGRCANCMV